MPTIKTDAMITRLEKEIEERNAFIEGLIAGAQDAERDITATEDELMVEARKRVESCEHQLSTLYESRSSITSARRRVTEVSDELHRLRDEVDRGAVEYRSAGAYIVDQLAAYMGNRDAFERLEVYTRQAQHQTTSDNLGVIPDPIVGGVLNFIDEERPLVAAIGVQPLPSGTFYRPKVTQHTQVGQQLDGTTPTEKAELVSRKMLLSRLTVEAETFGGYVNVSRQNIDWSSPQIFDLIVNDLAGQYALETEEATAAAIGGVNTPPVEYPLDPTADELAAAFWQARAGVYSAVGNAGSVMLAISPERLAAFGPLFAPYGATNAHGQGFSAATFSQGPVGVISGVPVYMSKGLGSGEAYMLSTAAVEVWEQRIGTLQVVEPSVLGVQVAYAGYFATLIAQSTGIVPLEEGSA